MDQQAESSLSNPSKDLANPVKTNEEEESATLEAPQEETLKKKKVEKSLVDKLKLPLCLHSRTGLCKH